MKNVYIFLTNGIDGINGVLVYLRNKKLYLEKNNWLVRILYWGKGTVCIPNLEDSACQFDFLKYYPCYFNRLAVEHCLGKMVECLPEIDETSECYIESDTNLLACWGEALAEKIGKKHIINFVQEKPQLYTDEYYDFMKFKLQRNELFGMSENSIHLLMEGRMNVPIDKKFQMKTPCDNTVEDVESKLLDYYDDTAEFHICTVGRLEKPYIIPMIKDVVSFAKKHNTRIQLFIIAGAYHPELIEKTKMAFTGQTLVSFYISGFVYPVPLKLLHKMDLAIGCAGSNLTTYQAGVPTIAIDVSDLKPIGIYGVTTTNTHYRLNGESVHSIVEWMEEVLYNRVTRPRYLTPDYSYIDNEIEHHLLQIKDSEYKKEYYNISNVTNEGGNYKRRITFAKIFGPNMLFAVMRYKESKRKNGK